MTPTDTDVTWSLGMAVIIVVLLLLTKTGREIMKTRPFWSGALGATVLVLAVIIVLAHADDYKNSVNPDKLQSCTFVNSDEVVDTYNVGNKTNVPKVIVCLKQN